MTTSIFILLLLPLFLIPTILLSKNKVRFYTFCSTIAVLPLLITLLLNVFFKSINICDYIGNTFLGMFSFLVNRSYLTNSEILHLSYYLTCLFFYGVFYFISFLILKMNYIGVNPNTDNISSKFINVFIRILFFITTYLVLVLFIIEIREIIPFDDGFLSFFFDWIYHIER